MTLTFFATQAAFRAWLEKHHKKETELIIGFYKVSSCKPSMTWSQSVDQALCFGWIDSKAKPLDEEKFMQFFSRRKPKSVWSRINKEKINEQNPQILYYYELKGKYNITTNAKGYLKDYREVELDIAAEQKTETIVIELVKNRMKQEIDLFDVSTNLKISSGSVSIMHVETGQKIFDGKIFVEFNYY